MSCHFAVFNLLDQHINVALWLINSIRLKSATTPLVKHLLNLHVQDCSTLHYLTLSLSLSFLCLAEVYLGFKSQQCMKTQFESVKHFLNTKLWPLWIPKKNLTCCTFPRWWTVDWPPKIYNKVIASSTQLTKAGAHKLLLFTCTLTSIHGMKHAYKQVHVSIISYWVKGLFDILTSLTFCEGHFLDSFLVSITSLLLL